MPRFAAKCGAMKYVKILALLFIAPLALFARKYASPDEFWADVNPIFGPQTVDIGSKTQLKLKEGYLVLKGEDVKKFCEFTENLYGGELAVLLPEDGSWFANFSYEDSGYIKEEKIDADAIFSSMKSSEPQANKVRESRGYGKLYLDDWFFKPAYNPTTKNLEWAFLFKDENGNETVNFNTRILGRTGYTSIILAISPEQKSAVSDFQSALSGFEYKQGSRYAEWKEGDKVAKYGLSALIAGGAAVVAAKSGFLAKFWKVLVLVVVVVVGGIAKFFKKIAGKE